MRLQHGERRRDLFVHDLGSSSYFFKSRDPSWPQKHALLGLGQFNQRADFPHRDKRRWWIVCRCDFARHQFELFLQPGLGAVRLFPRHTARSELVISGQVLVREDDVGFGTGVVVLEPPLNVLSLVVVPVRGEHGVLEEDASNWAEELVRGVRQGDCGWRGR